MADNRKRAPRGGKQAASGSRPIRRNDRAAAPKGQRDRTQAARPQRDRNRDAVQAPKGEFIEGRRAAAEALRTGFPIKCALIAEGGERDAALSRLVDDLNAAGVRIKYVPRAQLDALSSHGAHQGIALEVGNFPYADVVDILDRAGDGPALVVVLDHEHQRAGKVRVGHAGHGEQEMVAQVGRGGRIRHGECGSLGASAPEPGLGASGRPPVGPGKEPIASDLFPGSQSPDCSGPAAMTAQASRAPLLPVGWVA